MSTPNRTVGSTGITPSSSYRDQYMNQQSPNVNKTLSPAAGQSPPQPANRFGNSKQQQQPIPTARSGFNTSSTFESPTRFQQQQPQPPLRYDYQQQQMLIEQENQRFLIEQQELAQQQEKQAQYQRIQQYREQNQRQLTPTKQNQSSSMSASYTQQIEMSRTGSAAPDTMTRIKRQVFVNDGDQKDVKRFFSSFFLLRNNF